MHKLVTKYLRDSYTFLRQAAFCLLAAAAVQRAAGQEFKIKPIDRSIRLELHLQSHPGDHLELWLPETIWFTTDAFKWNRAPREQWLRDGNGWWNQSMGITGLTYHARAKAVADHVDLEIECTNTSEIEYLVLSAWPCLKCGSSQHYKNSALDRMHFRTAEGWQRLSDVALGVQNVIPIIGTGDKRPEGVFKTVPRMAVMPLMTLQSVDESDVLYAVWEEAFDLAANGDFSCIHVNALLHNLGPGQTEVMRGRVGVVHGTLDDVLKAVEGIAKPPLVP